MHLGVLVDGLGPDLKRGIEFASSVGLERIEAGCTRGEITPRGFSRSARRDFRGFLSRKGLTLAAVRAELTAPLTNPEANNRNVGELAACFELAGDLGAGAVVVSLGAIPEDEDDPRCAAAREALSDLEAAATRHGVLLAVRSGTGPAEVLAGFLESAALPFVKVAFDPGEFALRGFDVPSGVERLASWITHAYARDARAHASGCAVGTGDVPWPEYLATLSGIDYGGPLVIVPPAGPGAREAVARAAEFLRRF